MNSSKVLFLLLSAIICSCASKKDILYLQDIETYISEDDSVKNTIVIKKNDLLSIIVSSKDRKSAALFNLPVVSTIGEDITNVNIQQRLQTYLVNNNGEIEMPVIGVVKLLGESIQDATEIIKKEVSRYVKDPIVNLRISNFQIAVLGEVRKPGNYDINDHRITILEAISRAGGLTVFGKRKDVLVIREEKGKKKYYKLDFTKKNIFNSECYYLHQNDVVIVSPNKTQVQSSAFGRNTSALVSIAGVIISVITLLTR